MFKAEAVIQPSKLADVLTSLHDLDVSGISISEVLNHGGHAAAPVINLGMVVSSLRVDDVVDAISRAARTGFSGDDGDQDPKRGPDRTLAFLTLPSNRSDRTGFARTSSTN